MPPITTIYYEGHIIRLPLTSNSHSFCVVQAIDDSRNIFIAETIKRGISEGCAVIIASELNSKAVAELLYEKKLSEVQGYIDNGLLTVLDKDFMYSMAQTGLYANKLLIERWLSIISDVRSRSGRQRIVVIGTTKVFFETDNFEKLRLYESTGGKKFSDTSLEAICCYDTKFFSELSLKDIINVLDYHENVIYSGGVYTKWHPSMILELIKRGIDRALGQGSAALVLNTMHLIYKFDDDDDDLTIVSQPELFEDKLRKLLGATADVALDRIKKEITAELSYLHRKNDDNTEDAHGWRSMQ